ncbi:hypothetical protein [Bradyrhizobium liaoningense]|uniref:hypothetical protein n=1 Tax=Bradyrhizobium liaoningense TaxID=43992 RepID=UPI001BABCAF8|nr:hypothetical protein [Bradyrhizobium liaoningense]MBR0906641.1 hypothetical protein [Bradyrhizobium liaoningense]
MIKPALSWRAFPFRPPRLAPLLLAPPSPETAGGCEGCFRICFIASTNAERFEGARHQSPDCQSFKTVLQFFLCIPIPGLHPLRIDGGHMAKKAKKAKKTVAKKAKKAAKKK